MNLLNVILMAPSGGEGGQGSGMTSLLMLLAIVVVFYFFMIRPQMKRGKEERKFREGLKKGDKVMVLGSIHGRITEVNDNTLEVEIGNNTHITVEKASVTPIREASQK